MCGGHLVGKANFLWELWFPLNLFCYHCKINNVYCGHQGSLNNRPCEISSVASNTCLQLVEIYYNSMGAVAKINEITYINSYIHNLKLINPHSNCTVS